MGRYAYTHEELDILREFYPREGALGVAARISRGGSPSRKKHARWGCGATPVSAGIVSAGRGAATPPRAKSGNGCAGHCAGSGWVSSLTRPRRRPSQRAVASGGRRKRTGRGHGILLNRAKLAALPKCGCMPNALAFLAWETVDSYDA